MGDMTSVYKHIQQFIHREYNAHSDLHVDSYRNKSLKQRMVEDLSSMATCCHNLIQSSEVVCGLSDKNIDQLRMLVGGPEVKAIWYMLKKDYTIHSFSDGLSRNSSWTRLYECIGGQYRRIERERYKLKPALRRMKNNEQYHAYEAAIVIVDNLKQFYQLIERMKQKLEKLRDEQAGKHGILIRTTYTGFNAQQWRSVHI